MFASVAAEHLFQAAAHHVTKSNRMLPTACRIFSIVIALASLVPKAAADDWPQWRGPQRDGVWRESAIVEKFASKELTPKWRVEIGSGYCGPTVANGRVYVMDLLQRPRWAERVLCFDETTGSKLWSIEYECSYGRVQYPAGPRASVTIDNGRAYALGATGRFHVLDAATGKLIWESDLDERFRIRLPQWGITAAPLIHENLVILHIGGEGACVVALNKETGAEVWRALSDRAQYSAPIIVSQAGQPVVLCWTGDSVAGLAAATGKVLWRYEWTPRNMPIGVATPVVENDRAFFTSFYDGSLMLRLLTDKPGIEKVWQIAGRDELNTDALHSIISTPVFENGYIYGVDSYGELRCLDGNDGRRLWEDLTAVPKARWSTIHFVKHADRYLLFNERGDLIIAKLSPRGYEEISRAKLLEPTEEQLRQRGGVCWSHPAFANKHVYARNDKELVCVSLAAE
jgi:outer membrane protein assembly factor BamB